MTPYGMRTMLGLSSGPTLKTVGKYSREDQRVSGEKGLGGEGHLIHRYDAERHQPSRVVVFIYIYIYIFQIYIYTYLRPLNVFC